MKLTAMHFMVILEILIESIGQGARCSTLVVPNPVGSPERVPTRLSFPFQDTFGRICQPHVQYHILNNV